MYALNYFDYYFPFFPFGLNYYDFFDFPIFPFGLNYYDFFDFTIFPFGLNYYDFFYFSFLKPRIKRKPDFFLNRVIKRVCDKVERIGDLDSVLNDDD